MSTFKRNDSDKELFKDVVFLIEANDNESHLLWEKYHYKTDKDVPHVKLWEQEFSGYMIKIGELDNRPINVTLSYAKLNGKRILFYNGCSQLVDHKMIEDWLQHFTKDIRWDNNHRWAHCDAMNFHHCLDAIGVIDEFRASKKK